MDTREPIVDTSESSASGGSDGRPETDASAQKASDPPASVDAITAERDRLIEEKNDLMDRLLRRQAEFDNFRRRAERERADVLEFAHTESVRSILPILDDFERALKTETADREYARGMEMIYQRLSDA